MAIVPRLVFGALFAVAVFTGGETIARAEVRRPFLGACYCRAGETLKCTADLTEPDCRRRCDDALCDDWFWKERLPCWNWGYGG
jgi:hypothetical protein